MLLTDSHLCQDNRRLTYKPAELAAGAKNVVSLTLANKRRNPTLVQYRLEVKDDSLFRTPEPAPWEIVERDEIDFASHAGEKLGQSFRVLIAVIHAGEQDVLKREPTMWRQWIVSARLQQ